MNKKKNRVTIITVSTNQEKVRKIINQSIECLKEKKRLIFFVENDQAGRFLDDLLWNGSNQSFIPHCLTDHECIDPIVITQSEKNLNSADYVFNLMAHAKVKEDQSLHIIELYDKTDPAREKISENRLQEYIKSEFQIISHNVSVI